MISLVPRPLPVFDVASKKTGGPGMQNHVHNVISRQKVDRRSDACGRPGGLKFSMLLFVAGHR